MRKVIIMGAGGRDFHNFNVVFRDDPDTEVVAFTAAQIPGIEDRVYPPSLAGPRYPNGIRIAAEDELAAIVRADGVDEVVFAYSDVEHREVMHRASIALAAGADFRLLGPKATMLTSIRPVVAVGAVRTGSGKSQTTRRVVQLLAEHDLRAVLIRHPMPYGDLERMRVQRFETLADVDASDPTIEEREEYEAPVRAGMVMYAGVDYAEVLRRAEAEADVIVWDGGNNDFPFIAPDVMITVADPLRAGHELAYHPGETTFRLADIIVINKVDTADLNSVARVVASARDANPAATIVKAASPVTLEDGPSLAQARVLVVEDGPTITHGGMPFGAGTVGARQAGALEFIDARPYAVGSIADTFDRYPRIGKVLPAMGYGAEQLQELEDTINSVPCDVVITGTPIDLARVIDVRHPVRKVRYELRDFGDPTLADTLAPLARKWREQRSVG